MTKRAHARSTSADILTTWLHTLVWTLIRWRWGLFEDLMVQIDVRFSTWRTVMELAVVVLVATAGATHVVGNGCLDLWCMMVLLGQVLASELMLMTLSHSMLTDIHSTARMLIRNELLREFPWGLDVLWAALHAWIIDMHLCRCLVAHLAGWYSSDLTVRSIDRWVFL